jgi:hypothetical protein
VNAVDAFSCEENESPQCFSHSAPRLVSSLQMGGLSLTKIFCNARVSACSIEDRDVRTRASCAERRLCNVKTWSRPDSAACRVRSMELTTLCTLCKTAGGVRAVSPIGALPARSCSTDPHARVALPDLWRAVSARERIPTNAKIFPGTLEPVKHVEGRTRPQEARVVADSNIDFICQDRESAANAVRA